MAKADIQASNREPQEVTIEDSTPARLDDQLGDAHLNLLPRKKLLICLFSMSFGLFTCFADQTGIVVALPEIGRDLNAVQTINWAGTAALLANTVCQVLFGRFADIFGRKAILLVSLIILAIADLACGFAQTGPQFYIFRAFAGIGGGGIQSLTMVIISDIVTLKQRGKYQGIMGASVGLGNAVGPLVMAGFSMHSTWRNFYRLMPALIAAQAFALYFLLDQNSDKLNNLLSKKEKFKKIDYYGIFFSTAGLTLLLIPINGGGSTYPWNSALVISMFVIGGLGLIGFLIIEWKVPVLPMIPIRLFTAPSLCLILSSNFFFGMVYYSFNYYIPYYYQIVKGESVLVSSLLLLPLVLSNAINSSIGGIVISETDHYIYVILVGYGLWFLSCCLLLLFDANTKSGVIIGVLIIMGAGIGWTFQPTMVAAQANARKADRAVVIGSRNVIRSFGGAMGTAIASLIVSNGLIQEINNAIQNPDSYENIPVSYLSYVKKNIYTQIEISGLNNSQIKVVKQMYMTAIRHYFYLNIPLIGICFIASLFVKDRGLQCIDESPEEAKDKA